MAASHGAGNAEATRVARGAVGGGGGGGGGLPSLRLSGRRPTRRSSGRRPAVVARMSAERQTEDSPLRSVGKAVGGAAAAALLSLGTVIGPGVALASEFDILTEATPTEKYVIDDAGVLSKSTKSDLNKRLKELEKSTGYRLEVATVRKLEFETDAFSFGDKVIEKWYPSVEQGTKKGILLVVTTAKDGALTGGPQFLKAVGDDLIDSIVVDNIPILGEEEKYNETVVSSLNRIEAVITGQEDPGPPPRKDNTRRRTYKTKEETGQSKDITSAIVVTLLIIAVVVPMVQYWGYTSLEKE